MSRRPIAGLGIGLAACAVLGTASVARADWLTSLESPFRNAVQSGNLGMALALVFLAGVATSLTPCVYPMIAITVSVFGAREAKSRLEGAGLSTAYVLGIAALFTPMGIGAAVTGSLFGSLLSNPFVVGGLALLFAALALSMFGLFDLALPSALQNRLAQVGGAGWKGAFALGFVSGLIAAPCTGPVLAFLLTWIGTTGRVGFGGVALFVYSLGLGVLFWIVGTFAVSLPKSGRWLESVKSAFGALMVVMAIYFIRAYLPFQRPTERTTMLIAMGVAAMVAGVVLGAIHLSYHDPRWSVRVRKTVGLLSVVAGAVLLLFWSEALPPGAKIAWLSDYRAAVALGKKENRPVLVDFGASWCGACGELDRETFSDPRVVAATLEKQVVAVRVDLSPSDDLDQNKAILASYQQKGLPLVVLHGRGGAEVGRVTSFVEAHDFVEFLSRVD